MILNSNQIAAIKRFALGLLHAEDIAYYAETSVKAAMLDCVQTIEFQQTIIGKRRRNARAWEDLCDRYIKRQHELMQQVQELENRLNTIREARTTISQALNEIPL
jgi:hypothetical protein